jgi:hypothetical protein
VTPEEVFEWVEKAWFDGYDTAQAILLDAAQASDKPDVAQNFLLAAALLANVKPSGKFLRR